MVKKAKLDLLEEKIEEENGAAVPSDQGEGQAAARSRFISGKLFVLILGAGLFLAAAGLSLWMFARPRTAPIVPAAVPEQAAVPAAALPAKEDIAASFPGFVIHLKDGQGNDRTLLCGIALALNDTPAEAKRIEQRMDVRTIVYAAARNRESEVLASRDGMNQLRREINDKVDGLLGTGRVKSVYFTEFVIL